jgi:hypothetical protein
MMTIIEEIEAYFRRLEIRDFSVYNERYLKFQELKGLLKTENKIKVIHDFIDLEIEKHHAKTILSSETYAELLRKLVIALDIRLLEKIGGQVAALSETPLEPAGIGLGDPVVADKCPIKNSVLPAQAKKAIEATIWEPNNIEIIYSLIRDLIRTLKKYIKKTKGNIEQAARRKDPREYKESHYSPVKTIIKVGVFMIAEELGVATNISLSLKKIDIANYLIASFLELIEVKTENEKLIIVPASIILHLLDANQRHIRVVAEYTVGGSGDFGEVIQSMLKTLAENYPKEYQNAINLFLEMSNIQNDLRGGKINLAQGSMSKKQEPQRSALIDEKYVVLMRKEKAAFLSKEKEITKDGSRQNTQLAIQGFISSGLPTPELELQQLRCAIAVNRL